MGKFKDLTGQKFGNWLVLEYAGNSYWICKCTCGSEIIRKVYRGSLLKGASYGCGHCNRGIVKRNQYDLSKEYGIGWTTNSNQPFFFDLEDYDKIKDYCWMENDKGYIYAQKKKKNILLHRLVLNAPNSKFVDHIFHNKKDCRKSQMRLVSNQQNSMNRESKGVYWDKTKHKWIANLSLTINGKRKKFFKRFDNYEEAVNYRKYLEKEYFKEYRNLSKEPTQ